MKNGSQLFWKWISYLPFFPAEAARLHEGSARCGLYLLTCWSNENADELFLDVVCDGGHDAPIGEGNRERLHVEFIVTRSSPNVIWRGSMYPTRNEKCFACGATCTRTSRYSAPGEGIELSLSILDTRYFDPTRTDRYCDTRYLSTAKTERYSHQVSQVSMT